MMTVQAKCNVIYNGIWYMAGDIFDVNAEEVETLKSAQCVEVIETYEPEQETEQEVPAKEEKPKRSRSRKAAK